MVVLREVSTCFTILVVVLGVHMFHHLGGGLKRGVHMFHHLGDGLKRGVHMFHHLGGGLKRGVHMFHHLGGGRGVHMFHHLGGGLKRSVHMFHRLGGGLKRMSRCIGTSWTERNADFSATVYSILYVVQRCCSGSKYSSDKCSTLLLIGAFLSRPTATKNVHLIPLMTPRGKDIHLNYYWWP